jgi:general secretion pathway protein A
VQSGYQAGVYLEYYGLKEAPFNITPNPRFLYFSPKHREALNHLLYGIRQRKGFVQLTGEVGAGKTTISRALLEQLGPDFSTALILNPALDFDQLLKSIAMELNLPFKGLDRLEMIAELNHFLLQQVEQRKDTVVFIDDAQGLSNEVLEQLRLLSNLETDERKLLQIVLMGQPELRDRLDDHSLRQLRQRITVRYHLNPLNRAEAAQYIQHRLQVSGANGSPTFTAPAVWRIHRYSRGVPRLINAVCDKCLLAGFVQRRQKIDFSMVGRAMRELEGEIDP